MSGECQTIDIDNDGGANNCPTMQTGTPSCELNPVGDRMRLQENAEDID